MLKAFKFPAALLLLLAAGCAGEPESAVPGTAAALNSEAEITAETAGIHESADDDSLPGAGEISASEEKKNGIDAVKVTYIQLGSVRCVPCRMMQPVIDEIRKEYAGSVNVVFHDVWTPEGNPYARMYGIQAIPSQIFLDKDGEEYFRNAGYLHKEQIVAILRRQGVE